MTARPCTCDDALPAHYLWSGCSADGCPCTYRYAPGSSSQARTAAKEAVAAAVRRAKVEGNRL